MTEKIYEFYVLDPSAEATERRSTNYWVASPKNGRHKIFRGTLKDFDKVVDLYSNLWDAVMDSQLGLLGDEHAGVLTDDPILQNWEGAQIIAIGREERHGVTQVTESWYIDRGELSLIGYLC